MLPNSIIKGFDEKRLRNLLALFFLALAIPTAVLIWQAYGQLKWEAFHQHRVVAEELTRRIDTRLDSMIRSADGHSFADYTFLVVSGDPSANFVQRSPLSTYPVAEGLPGVLGYFQVDTAGAFSTPLLPPEGAEATKLGIGATEYAKRVQLAQHIQAILADNRLVQSRPVVDDRPGVAKLSRSRQDEFEGEVIAEEKEYGAASRAIVSEDADILAATPSEQLVGANENYSQQVFDQLNMPKNDGRLSSGYAGTMELDDSSAEGSQTEQRLNSIGKVSDLKLDSDLQQKSEEVERAGTKDQTSGGEIAYTPSRTKRREKIALPESVPPIDSEQITNVTGPTELRISTFESEIDPFEFSLLDSGHFVLFRKVWRDGERYIQGLLVDQDVFTEDIIGTYFVNTALSNMSNLIVAYQDDVIHTFSGRGESGYSVITEELNGELLYRSRLTAPLNSLELIFSINRLPAGAGAGVLGWVTLVLAVVIVGGFTVLYRLGRGQISLARQQQDFVSAVSHELKTPLTSIRMYGEMLKEGWADEEKRQTYYEFIHDESERLTRLISNVLQLARITRNEPQFDMKPTVVGDLMRNIESRISSQVERAGFELRFRGADDAGRATINIDEDCFTQVIINLVDNAIKFSRSAEEKVIEIRSKFAGRDRILFSVRDYGPGIPKDQMQKIFELFYRSESELTRETVGTGIGLAIVHQLTLAMNGSVDMINADPGAEFRITFSIAATV